MNKIYKFIQKTDDLKYFDICINFFLANLILNFVLVVINKYIPFEKGVTEILNSVSPLQLIVFLIIIGPLTFIKLLIYIEESSRTATNLKIKKYRLTLILGCILMIIFMTILTQYLSSTYEFKSIIAYVSIVSLLFIIICYHFFCLIYEAITKEIDSEMERKNFFLSAIAIIVTLVALLK